MNRGEGEQPVMSTKMGEEHKSQEEVDATIANEIRCAREVVRKLASMKVFLESTDIDGISEEDLSEAAGMANNLSDFVNNINTLKGYGSRLDYRRTAEQQQEDLEEAITTHP